MKCHSLRGACVAVVAFAAFAFGFDRRVPLLGLLLEQAPGRIRRLPPAIGAWQRRRRPAEMDQAGAGWAILSSRSLVSRIAQ